MDTTKDKESVWTRALAITALPGNEAIVDKKKRYGYCHAFIMLLCFCIVLGTVYTEQQTYRYTASHTSFMKVLNKDLADNVESIDDIWDWLKGVVSNIGSRTVDHVEGNCDYAAANSQTVMIDGVSYNLLNPALQTQACDVGNLHFIQGGLDEVYLTGNHMILTFGVFSDRSSPYFPVKGSSTKDFKVRSSLVKSLDPIRDDKVVEICASQWTNKCLYKDGFAGDPGTTFGWLGYRSGDEYIFENSSSAMLFTDGGENEFIYPCYAYEGRNQKMPGDEAPAPSSAALPLPSNRPSQNPTLSPTPKVSPAPPSSLTFRPTISPTVSPTVSPTRNPTPVPGPGGPGPPPTGRRLFGDDVIPGLGAPDGLTAADVVLSNCSLTWVSNGYDIRAGCMKDSAVQPSAFEAYLASVRGYLNVRDLQNAYFGCYSLVDVSDTQMDRTFVEATKTLDSYLKQSDSYGMFFSTENQEKWIQESREGILLLRRHEFIDKNTRVFRLFCITRNLGEDELFYSMLVFEFSIRTVGKISVNVEAKYVPIIQYYYGMDGYEWRVREVYVLEVMMLCIFILFVLRESHQLITKRILGCLTHAKHYWNGGSSRVRSVSPEPHALKKPTAQRSRSAGSSPRGMGEHIVGLADDFDHALDDIDDKLSELGDALEEYLPDIAGWNDILDWCTILVLVLGMSYRIAYVKAAVDFHNLVLDVEKSRTYDDHLERFASEFRHLGNLTEAIHMIAIAIVFVGLMQFFRYFSFDKRLGIVTETMSAAFKDLLPVLLIFATVLFAYGVLGTEIYGTELEEWSSLSNSLASLFILLLGEWGTYYDMREVSPIETGIFFWSFVVAIAFILFNMVLAVIFTVYDEKYSEIHVREADQDNAGYEKGLEPLEQPRRSARRRSVRDARESSHLCTDSAEVAIVTSTAGQAILGVNSHPRPPDPDDIESMKDHVTAS